MTDRQRRGLIDLCIDAALAGNHALLNTLVSKACELAGAGKSDTLRLDLVVECAIIRILRRSLRGLVRQKVYALTEEKGCVMVRKATGSESEILFVVDPVDESEALKAHAAGCFSIVGNPQLKMGDVLCSAENKKRWELINGSPATVTGSHFAISCIADGVPVCAVFLNYITQEMFVVCKEGVKRLPVGNSVATRPAVTLDAALREGTDLYFLPISNRMQGEYDALTVAGYLGKNKPLYEQNLAESFPITGKGACLFHPKAAVGPLRIFFSSDLYSTFLIGIVFANGEKITEWLHWVVVAFFVRDPDGRYILEIHELMPKDNIPVMKGVPMKVTEDYSVFRPSSKGYFLGIGQLLQLKNPHQHRDSLAILPTDNEPAKKMLTPHSRQIVLCA